MAQDQFVSTSQRVALPQKSEHPGWTQSVQGAVATWSTMEVTNC